MGPARPRRTSRSPDNPFRDRDGGESKRSRSRRKWTKRFCTIVVSMLAVRAVVVRLVGLARSGRPGLDAAMTTPGGGRSKRVANHAAYHCTDRLEADRTTSTSNAAVAAAAAASERRRDLLLDAVRARFVDESTIDRNRGGNVRILVVEAGTGRDLEGFRREGVEADGLEPCEDLIAAGAERRSAESSRGGSSRDEAGASIEVQIMDEVGFSDSRKRTRGGRHASRLWKTDLPGFLRAVEDDPLFALDDVGQYHGVSLRCGSGTDLSSSDLRDMLTSVADRVLVEGGVLLTCLPESEHTDLVTSIVSRRTGQSFRIIQQSLIDDDNHAWRIDGWNELPRRTTAIVSGIDANDPRVGRPGEFPEILWYHHETSHHDKRHNAVGGRGRKWSDQPDKFLVLNNPTGGLVVPLPLNEDPPPDTKRGAVTEGGGRGKATLDVPRFLQSAFGITAWKERGKSRWSVRSHPSSGGLQTAEVYVHGAAINKTATATADDNGTFRRTLWHYNSYWHVLQKRGVVPASVWDRTFGRVAGGTTSESGDVIFVLFSAVYGRNAWKYGEPAYWKGNLDAGHALGSAAAAARLQGHRAVVLDGADDDFLSEVLGLDKVGSAQRKCLTSRFLVNAQHPVGLMAIFPEGHGSGMEDGDGGRYLEAIPLMDFSRGGGLLEKIDFLYEDDSLGQDAGKVADIYCSGYKEKGANNIWPMARGKRQNGSFWLKARTSLSEAILERRTAKSYSAAESSMGLQDFLDVVSCLKTACGIAPHTPWEPGVHVLLFVHAVNGIKPGLYLLDRATIPGPDGPSKRLHDALRNALPNNERARPSRVANSMKSDLSSHIDLHDSFFRVEGNFDTRRIAQILSREQDIARDDTFTVSFLGNLDFFRCLKTPHWYRYVHWEAAALGHQLYLMAEALGFRGSGIGSFYNTMTRHFVFGEAGFSSRETPYDPVYHFTFGKADYDDRIKKHKPYSHLEELRGNDGGHAAMVKMAGY